MWKILYLKQKDRTRKKIIIAKSFYCSIAIECVPFPIDWIWPMVIKKIDCTFPMANKQSICLNLESWILSEKKFRILLSVKLEINNPEIMVV